MSERHIGVIINGATGRMGTTQHMANLLAVAAEGGLVLRNGDRLIPDLLLVGRDAGRLKALADAHGNQRWTTSLGEALSGPDAIFMDCAATGDRPARVRQAIAAGKHIHIEADRTHGGRSNVIGARGARSWLEARRYTGQAIPPRFREAAVREELGVFWTHPVDPHRCGILDLRRQGPRMPTAELELQARGRWRPRARYDGALALHDRSACSTRDRSVCADVDGDPGARGRAGVHLHFDVEDTSHALLQLAGGAVGVITNSWATRLRRDDTMVVQIDGTLGSAVAGRFRCFTQAAVNTPEAFFGAARPGGMDFPAQWQEVPDTLPTSSPFRQCWEAFLLHVAEDAPCRANLVDGAKAVQLADLAYRSVAEGRWMTVPDLKL
jgi:predicted dehydrogenase